MCDVLTLADSRFVGDDRFEKAAYKVGLNRQARRKCAYARAQAYFALWNRRSDIGLVANTINVVNGVS
jgi:hypothetical protein